MTRDNHYIGLMSGTSADAIDAVLVKFHQDTPAVLHSLSTHLSPEIRQAVQQLAIPGDNEIELVRLLDQEIGLLSAQLALTLCQKANVCPSQIIAIASHGQTVRHHAPSQQLGYSLQVGDPNIIAHNTGITTVADFRRRDIAAGGQGAPLVPAFHQAVFYSTTKNRIILNTGGIANITFLPTKGDVIGFDTGPANTLLDAWCQQHRGTAYDENGRWAASGTTHTKLLSRLLAHPYFALPYPKSTGREVFNLAWLQEEITKHAQDIATEDVQASLLQLTVKSITQHIDNIDPEKAAEVFICGGGTYNTTLVTALEQELQPRPLASTQKLGIPANLVEATAFAWLAKQTMEKATGNLPSVTGAQAPCILGGIYSGGIKQA